MAIKLLENFIIMTIIEVIIKLIMAIEFATYFVVSSEFVVSFVLADSNSIIINFLNFILEFVNLSH